MGGAAFSFSGSGLADSTAAVLGGSAHGQEPAGGSVSEMGERGMGGSEQDGDGRERDGDGREREGAGWRSGDVKGREREAAA
jgi:hypothetical protein